MRSGVAPSQARRPGRQATRSCPSRETSRRTRHCCCSPQARAEDNGCDLAAGNQNYLYVTIALITRALFFTAFSQFVRRNSLDYNDLRRDRGVFCSYHFLRADEANTGGTTPYAKRRRVLYKVVLYVPQQPLKLPGCGANGWTATFFVTLAGSVELHVVRVSLFPHFLAVLA
jgi:hypothetical protein